MVPWCPGRQLGDQYHRVSKIAVNGGGAFGVCPYASSIPLAPGTVLF